jgi:hypothetical protein
VEPYTDRGEIALNFLCHCQETEPREPTYAARVKLAVCRRRFGTESEVCSSVEADGGLLRCSSDKYVPPPPMVVFANICTSQQTEGPIRAAAVVPWCLSAQQW